MSIEHYNRYSPESDSPESEKKVERLTDLLQKVQDILSLSIVPDYLGVHRGDCIEKLLQAVEDIVKDEMQSVAKPEHKSHNFTAETHIHQALSIIRYDSEQRH